MLGYPPCRLHILSETARALRTVLYRGYADHRYDGYPRCAEKLSQVRGHHSN